MKKKVLFCATVDYHFKKFHLPYLKWFQEKGWEVHVAAAGTLELPFVDKKYDIAIQRSPFRKENIKSYRELKKIINENHYSIIHCHTPMGGVLTRLAARRARKQGTQVLYTAHGFHFYKGAPLLNWLVYYPIERLLARFTDCLITINDEDFSLAKKHRFHAKHINHVHGVGVDTERFNIVDSQMKQRLRSLHGYNEDDFLMFYAAEFNENKNQTLLIHALSLIKQEVPHAKLLLAGEGALQEECKQLANELEVGHMVDFLGYKDNIEPYLKMSDLSLASSLREGLPVNVMEAMACGLPILASKNRGHNELVKNGMNGYVLSHKDHRLFASRLLQLSQSKKLCEKMGRESRRKIENYSLNKVGNELIKIYLSHIKQSNKVVPLVDQSKRKEGLG